MIGRLRTSFGGSECEGYIQTYSGWLNGNWSSWTPRSQCRIFVFRQETVWNVSLAIVWDSTVSA